LLALSSTHSLTSLGHLGQLSRLRHDRIGHVYLSPRHTQRIGDL
jgi:hypothetical protein